MSTPRAVAPASERARRGDARLSAVAQQRAWTTAGAPTVQQFGLWQEAVDQAFVPVDVLARRHDSFVSGVSVRALGGVALADIVSQPQTASRTSSQIRSAEGNVYFLNLPLSAGASAGQGGRTARLSAGDFVVVDGDRPFDLEFARPFRQISLTLPRDAVQSRLASPHDVTGVRVAGDRGLGAVASAAIRAAATAGASLDRRSGAALGDQLVELVALALGGVRPPARSTPRSLLLQAVLDEVDRSMSQPDLDPALVAARVGVSVRYLHALMSDHGPTFGRWLTTRRLARARGLLTDPARAASPVARIARECGYTDASHFARLFKAEYGCTPRQLRATPTP